MSMFTSTMLLLSSVAALTKDTVLVVMFVITFVRWFAIGIHSFFHWEFFLFFDPLLMSVMTLNGIGDLVYVTFHTSL